jgi:ATP phosphoribosyltransferase regulatory subunit
MYKLIDNRGRILTLRPDSTIPIARMTATKLKGCGLPARMYYAQRVFRSKPELKGKRGEMMQMGVELVGLSTFESDIEILGAAAEAMAACSSSHFRLELGHVGVFNKLMSSLEAGEEEKSKIHGYIVAKNYAALGDALERLPQSRTAELLRELPRLFGGEEALEAARALFDGFDDGLTEMLAHLERVYKILASLDLSDQVMIDFGLVNQAEYYSALVFKGYMASSGDAVLSGGRYDSLFRDFGEDMPATGFALDVDALAEGLLKNGPPPESGAECPAPQSAGLRIALTKGRLEKDVIRILAAAGYDTSNLHDKGRRLMLPIPGAGIEVVLVKAADVITYVEHGACDAGVVGKDTIAEHGGVFYEIMDLGTGKCRFVLAAPKGTDFYGGFGGRRIATKYPAVAGAWFESKGMDVSIIKIEGSVELAPLMGLADGIVDIVETGATLRENGLEVIEDIRPLSARMIVNVASMKLKKKEIDSLTAALQAALDGGGEGGAGAGG